MSLLSLFNFSNILIYIIVTNRKSVAINSDWKEVQNGIKQVYEGLINSTSRDRMRKLKCEPFLAEYSLDPNHGRLSFFLYFRIISQCEIDLTKTKKVIKGLVDDSNLEEDEEDREAREFNRNFTFGT